MGDPFSSSPFDFMFTIGPIIIGSIFLLVIGTILFTIIKGLGTWQKNNHSPKLSVPAIVKTKRTNVRRHGHLNDDNLHSSTNTTYYATFEFESGDRSEFLISGTEFGQLAEGDHGILSFQGTRYLEFQRNIGVNEKV